jgi:hypothetical protein
MHVTYEQAELALAAAIGEAKKQARKCVSPLWIPALI